MLSNIRLLFNERATLIAKQLTLARNLEHQYVSQKISKSSREYGSLYHIQSEINQKEKTISEMFKLQNINSNSSSTKPLHSIHRDVIKTLTHA